MLIYDNIHEAYLGTLEDIYFNYDYKTSPRGMPIREKLDYTFKVKNPVAEPIVTKDIERNKVIADYTAKEIDLYNSCSNKVEDFAKASKFWEKLANPDGTVNSAYGYLIWHNKSHGHPVYEATAAGLPRPIATDWNFMKTPWEWAKQCLIDDKDTRQAILRFSLPEHQYRGNKDQTCTLHGLFLVREDKLHLSVVLRLNDWNKGILYDLPFFCSLMDKMLEELRSYYPTLNKGHYTHTAHSAHIYEKDEKIILSMLGRRE